MELLGNPEVIANFLRKEKALAKNERLIPPIRTALIVPGGGTAGIVTAGALQALSGFISHAPDVCAGVSVGAVNLYSYLAGDAHLTPYMYPLLVKAGLISVGRNRWDRHFNIDFVTDVLRYRKKQELVLNHRSHFIVYATEFNSAQGIGLDGKRAKPDIVEAIRASCMLPGMCSGTVRLDGKDYVDGGCGIPFPVRHVTKKFRPTDILVLLNRPLPQHMGWFDWYWFPVYSWLYLWWMDVPRSIRDSMAMADRVIAHELHLLMRYKRVRWCIIAPEPHEAVSYDCTDVNRLMAAASKSYHFTRMHLVACERELKAASRET